MTPNDRDDALVAALRLAAAGGYDDLHEAVTELSGDDARRALRVFVGLDAEARSVVTKPQSSPSPADAIEYAGRLRVALEDLQSVDEIIAAATEGLTEVEARWLIAEGELRRLALSPKKTTGGP